MLAMLTPDQLTPIDPGSSPDPLIIIHDAIEVFKDWKTSGWITGLTMIVYLLTMLSKNTFVLKQIPPYWRPYVALVLGVATGSASALAGGARFWPGAVAAGLAAGFGSIAFDQLVTQWKAGVEARLAKRAANGGGTSPGPGPSSVKTAGIILLAGALTSGCACFKSFWADAKACSASDPTTFGRLIDALIDFGECGEATANAGAICPWIAAIEEIEPNKDTLKCDLNAIVQSAEKPDAGFSYTLSDGGVVSVPRLAAPQAVPETSNQRLVRRAQTYLSAVK